MTEIPIQMPKSTLAVTEATFVEWLVEDGALVDEEQPIYSVATDKVEVEVNAPASGILRHGDAKPDQIYPVGHRLGSIESG